MCWWCAVRCNAGILLAAPDTCVFVCAAVNSRALRSAAGAQDRTVARLPGRGSRCQGYRLSLFTAFTVWLVG